MLKPISVITYNVHKGFSTGNLRYVLQDIRDALQACDADIVFLQEVVGQHNNHPTQGQENNLSSQIEVLADSVWEHYAYGKNSVYSSGHHGNAILSRYPIVEWNNLDISLTRWEKRGLLSAVVEIPECDIKLQLGCVHLNLLHRHRVQQLHVIKKWLMTRKQNNYPLILAGDFNDWSGQLSKLLGTDDTLVDVYHELNGRFARTFPARFPIFPLDRIYSRDFELVNAGVLDNREFRKLSDHLGIQAIIRPIEK